MDTQLLWEERQRLIEDIRQLADDVLATAENAHERVSMPQMLSRGRGAPTEVEPAERRRGAEESRRPADERGRARRPTGRRAEDEDTTNGRG